MSCDGLSSPCGSRQLPPGGGQESGEASWKSWASKKKLTFALWGVGVETLQGG